MMSNISAASALSTGSLPAPFVQSTPLSSHSADNLGRIEYSQAIDHATSNMLHLHPFSQASAPIMDSGCSLSSHWANPSSSATLSPASSNSTRPPSSASFIDMGKSKQGKKGYNHQVQSSSRSWGRNVSDGIPQLAYHARKSGSRFWRTLIRPSVLSFLDNPKYPETSSISAQFADLDPSSSSKELPPRPAPYFYPRRVDCDRDDMDVTSTTQDTFFCNLGELPIEGVSKHKSKCISVSRAAGELQGVCGGIGEEDGASVDSDEIETWKKRRTDLATKKSRPSLRQRLGSSLRQSIGFHQLRSACSELDLSQLSRQQDQPERFGPGITDDPFASLLTSPQLVPARVSFLPATSTLSLSATASLPFVSSSEPLLDLAVFNYETKRRSFMNMDPDCDDPSTSSSVSRSDTSHQPLSHVLYSKLGCSSVVHSSAQPVIEVMAPTPQFRPGRVSEDSGILCHTPVLTPDLDSIDASSPSFSDKFCAVDVTTSKHGQDPSGTHMIVPFPSLDSAQELPIIPDIFEESAVAEGTSQDQMFYSCALGLSHHSSASLHSGGNKSPKSRRKFSLRGVGGECIADVSVASIDMSESITDFTLLAVEWPLPPRETSPEPDGAHKDISDLERLAPATPFAARQSVRIQERDYSSTSLALDIPSLDESQTVPLVESLELPKLGSPQPSRPVMLSSPIDIVDVTLGSSILKHTSLPKVIVLAATTETGLTSSSISFRAASRPVLVSFFALHAETSLEAPCVPLEGTSMLANVRLCRTSDDSQPNPDSATVTLMNDSNEPQLRMAESGTISFSLGLPMTLGELAVAIAKVSFGKGLN